MLYLTLRQYEYLVTVARTGSLTAAAQQLNVSQPSLSVALTQVEAHLGRKLFQRRKGTALTLTPFGRSFADEAEVLLRRARRLEDPEQTGGAATPFTLACFVDIAPWYLAPALRHLRKAMPEVDFRVSEGGFTTLAKGILQGEIDLAISYDLGFDASFERQVLARVGPMAFLRPDDELAARPEILLRDLASRPLILFEEGLSIRHMLRLFHAQGLRPRIAHRAASLEVMRSLAAHGEGIGISYTVPPTDRTYDGTALITVPIGDPLAVEEIVLVTNGIAAPHPAMQDVRAAIAAIWR